MAGRWVAGMAVAALSVRGLATALVFLRGALIRTGIGALIVGAGNWHISSPGWWSGSAVSVRRSGAQRSGKGSLVAHGVGARRRTGADGRGLGGAEGGRASGARGHHRRCREFRGPDSRVFQGSYDAAVAIWGNLPGAIGDFAFQRRTV